MSTYTPPPPPWDWIRNKCTLLDLRDLSLVASEVASALEELYGDPNTFDWEINPLGFDEHEKQINRYIKVYYAVKKINIGDEDVKNFIEAFVLRKALEIIRDVAEKSSYNPCCAFSVVGCSCKLATKYGAKCSENPDKNPRGKFLKMINEKIDELDKILEGLL